MKNGLRLAVLALVAIAALEFAILGVQAGEEDEAGVRALPPVEDRNGDGLLPISLESGPPRAIELRSTPDEIACDGNDEATIRVRVRDGNDQPVLDGTYVEFWIEGHGYGRFSEWQVATSGGEASTRVAFQSFSQFEPYGFYVHAAAGRLEGAIRVYCAPAGSVCVSPPLSPPEHPLSPPCEVPPPPQSPPECIENPTSPPASVSPPCAEPPQSPPGGGDPPSPPKPAPDSLEVLFDCDVMTAGVQDVCELASNATTLTVGIVLQNNHVAAVGLDTVDVEVIAEDEPLISPHDVPGGHNGNPDFLEASLPPDEWGCVVNSDSEAEDQSIDISRITCFRSALGVNIESGEQLEFARVTYSVASTANDEEIELRNGVVDVSVNHGVPVRGCSRIITCAAVLISVEGGPERTSTPTATATPEEGRATAVESLDLDSTPAAPFFTAIDCDLDKDGVQDRCTYTTDDTLIEVGFVTLNNNSNQVPMCQNPDPTTCDLAVSSFNFVIVNPDRSRLDPPAILGNLDSNPDFYQPSHDESWSCLPPPPDNNRLPDDASGSESFLSCFSSSSAANSPLPPNSQHLGATVHYQVPGGAQPGSVELKQEFVGVGNPDGYGLVDCFSAAPQCLPATITLIDTNAPEATSTPTAVPTSTPTAPGGVGGPPATTNTPTPTPTSEPQEACADVTGDGLVTSNDVSAIAKHVGKSYDERYDVNGDGKVSVRDVIAAIMQRGRRC